MKILKKVMSKSINSNTTESSDKVREYAKKALKNGVLSKRAQKVVKILLDRGSITTKDINELGYNHPPRAIRDVRDAGIPLDTKMINISNKRMAQYIFGKESDINEHMLHGRTTFPKSFKKNLLAIQGNRCAICNQKFDEQYLQIDHRVPYKYNGDSVKLSEKDYMLLCAECNRKKDRATEIGCSKTCFTTNDPKIIRSCFWASPEKYTHICMQPIRRVDITWFKDEVAEYDKLEEKAKKSKLTIQNLIKDILKNN